MEAQAFAAGYDRTLSERTVHFGPQSEVMHEARNWSHLFGATTYDLMSRQTVERPEMTIDAWRQYRNWVRGIGLVQTIDAIGGLEDESRAQSYNEINFHCMNGDMLGMWIPLLFKDGWKTPDVRRDWINSAQEALARTGLEFYLVRKHYINIYGGTEAVYGAGADDPVYRAIIGVMQEYDAGIVLLDVMRRNPSITIVPAPMQFERSHHKGRNADFLAIDADAETVVGVQVKSRLRREDHQTADHDRVVFLDGDIDLGNIRAVRVKKGSSRERIVPWPGIVATKYIDRIKTHGKGKNLRAARNPQRTLQDKIEARKLVGDVQVDFSELSQKIGQRIMDKLAR